MQKRTKFFSAKYTKKIDPVDCSYLVNIIIIISYTNVFDSHIIYVDFNNCNLMNFLVKNQT